MLVVDIEDLKDMLNGLEIFEVKFNKHGKWLISSDGYYPYCSECKKEPKNREMTKFCAECGAKMDKEEI